MIVLLEAQDGQDLQEAYIELLAILVQFQRLGHLVELVQICSLHQEQLYTVETLQE